MSVDLDIAPLKMCRITWEQLYTHWAERLGNESLKLLGDDPRLLRLGSKSIVGKEDELGPGLMGYFDLASPNTLSIDISVNEEDLESDYLEDYGRNLEPTEIQTLTQHWQDVGYSFSLSSLGGRSKDEPLLLITLACAIAELCTGRVIVMNNGVFDINVGVYSSREFSNAKWMVRD